MKAKVIIENGLTSISLTPENDFEKDVIEKVASKGDKFNVKTDFSAQYNYGAYSKHCIDIDISEIRP